MNGINVLFLNSNKIKMHKYFENFERFTIRNSKDGREFREKVRAKVKVKAKAFICLKRYWKYLGKKSQVTLF